MIWKFANTVLIGYSLYVLETTKYVTGFCLPSNVQEDQPCRLVVRDKLEKSKLTVCNFIRKTLGLRAEHFWGSFQMKYQKWKIPRNFWILGFEEFSYLLEEKSELLMSVNCIYMLMLMLNVVLSNSFLCFTLFNCIWCS